MDLGIQIGQNQRLEQTVSPQMLQSVAILQKNSLELETAIKEEVEANPLLELDESEIDGNIQSEESLDNTNEFDSEVSKENELGEMEFERGTLEDSADTDYDIIENSSSEDWVKRLEEGSNDVDAPFKDLNKKNQESDDIWDRPQRDRELNLQDKLEEQLREWNGTRELMEQLSFAGCSENKFRELVKYLINSLDENGFLQSADEMAMLKVISDNDKFIVEIERYIRKELSLDFVSLPVAQAVHVLQSFKPRGIGARNLQESFLIQAMALEDFPEISIKILRNYFDDLMALRYGKIAKAESISTDEVQQIVASLSKLAPHPGLQISSRETFVKTVDMIVSLKKGEFEIECIKPAVHKRLRINKTYASMLNDKALNKSDREYIQNNLLKANEFIKSIDNRFSTMEQVMRSIVKNQKEFFKKGKAYLKPMILQDIADEVGRDLSTISRVVNGKYVETPYGIFELKQFFTSGVKQDSHENSEVVGSAQILDAIRVIIESENKQKPLSDQAISEKLESQGIKVARRTIAKYREEELKILPARLRKQV